MTDFNVQFITGTIPASTQTLDIATSIADLTRTFLIPAVCPQTGGGIGATTGNPINSWAGIKALIQIIDQDTIRFDDLNAGTARDNLCGAWLVDYVGPVGGVNEIVVRATQRFSSAAASFDGPAIAGITDINRCIPFMFTHNALNNNSFGDHFARARVVNDGVNNVVRVTKRDATDTMEVVVYVVELVGANWSLQIIDHTFVAADTNEDEAVAAVTLANTFTYTQFQPGANNQPIMNLHYVWLENTTTLRHFIDSFQAAPACRTYVVSNPQMNVQVVGNDPDGVADLVATGVSPETRTVDIAAIPNINRAFVLGYAGSNYAVNDQTPSAPVMFDFLDADTVRLRRSLSLGDTEYKIQAIDLNNLVGFALESVDPIINGSNFTATGRFGALTGDGVTLGGIVQAAVSGNATTIVRTGTLGTLRYGQPYDLVFTVGTTLTTQSTIEPAAGRDYVNLASLVQTGQRLTAIPDLAVGDQVEWFNVVGGDIEDVVVFDDGSFSADPLVESFDFRVNDGEGYGTAATQTITDEPVEVTNIPVAFLRSFLRDMTPAFDNYRHDP